jgi:Tol biopolymer transport system component
LIYVTNIHGGIFLATKATLNHGVTKYSVSIVLVAILLAGIFHSLTPTPSISAPVSSGIGTIKIVQNATKKFVLMAKVGSQFAGKRATLTLYSGPASGLKRKLRIDKKVNKRGFIRVQVSKRVTLGDRVVVQISGVNVLKRAVRNIVNKIDAGALLPTPLPSPSASPLLPPPSGGGGGGGGGGPTPPSSPEPNNFGAENLLVGVAIGNKAFVSWNNLDEPDSVSLLVQNAAIKTVRAKLTDSSGNQVGSSVCIKDSETLKLQTCELEIGAGAPADLFVQVEELENGQPVGKLRDEPVPLRVDPGPPDNKNFKDLPYQEPPAELSCGQALGFDKTQFSPSGTEIAFSSASEFLVAGDSNCREDIFVQDLVSGSITLISTAPNGSQGNADVSGSPTWSPDGAYIAFKSSATNLVPGVNDGKIHMYVKNLKTGVLSVVDSRPGIAVGNDETCGSDAYWSPDGLSIAFDSKASNLVSNDNNGVCDVFVKNLKTGSIKRVSTNSQGLEIPADSYIVNTHVEFASHLNFWSYRGDFATFTTSAPLVTFDTNGSSDVYIKNMRNNQVILPRELLGIDYKDHSSSQKSWSPTQDRLMVEFEKSSLTPRYSLHVVDVVEPHTKDSRVVTGDCPADGFSVATWNLAGNGISFFNAGRELCYWTLGPDVISTIDSGSLGLHGVGFSPDSSRLAYVGLDTKLKIKTIGSPDSPVEIGLGIYNDTYWSPDGSRIVAAQPSGLRVFYPAFPN